MLFLIPARAGSKRLPGKNKRLFCGLPLWMWSWATAVRCMNAVDYTIVDTDDDEILELINAIGQFGRRRAPELASDDAKTQDLVDLYLAKHNAVCLLQPTSPTRFDSLVLMMIARGDACRSVTNGVPNGQCYVYRRGMRMVDVETDQGHDIDTIDQFKAAERDMLRRFQ